MNRKILTITMASLLLAGGATVAQPLQVELVMGQNRSWKGRILERDGDWLNFNKDMATQPMRIGISTITEINFKVELSADRVSRAIESLDFDQAVKLLTEALVPFEAYNDVPSNLTPYNALLMELYYRTGAFDKTVALAKDVSKDERNPALQSKARVYWMLSLIDSGKAEEAAALMTTLKWGATPSVDAPPEELYIRAKLLALNAEYSQAMELAAKVVAFHSQDPDWMQAAELLCAEIYTELGMYESASEVCRQISLLYENTPEQKKADKLQTRIDRLSAEKDLQEI